MTNSGNHPPDTRTVRVVLSARQLDTILPEFQSVIRDELGVTGEQEDRISYEALARLTPDMTMSRMTRQKIISEEIQAYRADLEAHVKRGARTSYEMLALKAESPADLGRLSADLSKLVAPDALPPTGLHEANWFKFAHEVDGYKVAERLGWELADLAHSILQHYRHTNEWRGSYLDLHLTLFYKARALRFVNSPFEDDFTPESESLLATVVAAHRAGI